MISKCLLMLAAFSLCVIPVNGQEGEGHEFWWWDCNRTDFIVEGVITYDSYKYYEITPTGLVEGLGTYNWIVGNIRIHKILFINKYSPYVEPFLQYQKHMDKDYRVLISAIRRTAIPGKLVLQPMMMEIPKEPAIFNLSYLYMFPLNDLKVESVVPRGNANEALGLINKRPNNLLIK